MNPELIKKIEDERAWNWVYLTESTKAESVMKYAGRIDAFDKVLQWITELENGKK